MSRVVIRPVVNEVVIRPVVTRVKISTSGPQGIPGEDGPQGLPGAAGGSRIVHVQSTPAAVWAITHNLGYTPHVTVRVNGEDVTAGSDIFFIDPNSMTISFSTPLTGTVDLS